MKHVHVNEKELLKDGEHNKANEAKTIWRANKSILVDRVGVPGVKLYFWEWIKWFTLLRRIKGKMSRRYAWKLP